MNVFNEENSVELFIRDRLSGGITHHTAVGPGLARHNGQVSGLGWHFLAPQNLPRQLHEVLIEDHVREALIRLNPEIEADPQRAVPVPPGQPAPDPAGSPRRPKPQPSLPSMR